MNRHTLVTIAAIVAIAATVGYSSLGALSLNDLQIRWHDQGNFEYLSISFGGRVNICNASEHPANLKSYSFKMFYESSELGTFTTGGANIPPGSQVTLPGKFTTDDRRISEMFFAFFDTEFGGTPVTRIDASKMVVQTTMESSIIGFIPISFSKEYTGYEFTEMMNQKTRCDV